MIDLNNSQWRIAGGHNIQHRWFGEKCAVFHCGSGDTHLLDGLSFYILELLNDNAYTFDDLLEKIELELEAETPEDLQDYLKSLLSEFQKLSIIERLDV